MFPGVKSTNFVMFQCMACACLLIWDSTGNQFLWSPWSVLPAFCEFWLKLIVTFSGYEAIMAIGFCGHCSERK